MIYFIIENILTHSYLVSLYVLGKILHIGALITCNQWLILVTGKFPVSWCNISGARAYVQF